MTTKQYNVTTTATSISSIMEVDHCKGIVIQAASANSGVVNFGNKGAEVMFLIAGGSSAIDTNSLTDIYVKGTLNDKLNILVY